MTAQVIHLVEEAWNRYVVNDELDTQKLRPEVASSWQRCRNLRVDPFGHENFEIRDQEIKERLRISNHLVTIARPYLHNLYNYVRGSGFQVLLADKEGFILETIGDPEMVRRARALLLCPGGNWSEAIKGTNAIGTCLVEGKPIQILAREHYCQPNHCLTGCASPIFNPDGILLGALNISGDCKAHNPHVLALVVAAVNAIENQLRLHKATNKLYMAYKFSNTLLESITDGIMSVESNGMITQLNSCAARIVGLNQKDSVGKHITNVLKKPSFVLQALSAGAECKDQEVVIDDFGKKISHSVTPLRDDLGNSIGALVIFKEIKDKYVPRKNSAPSARYVFEDIFGESESVARAINWARVAAKSPSTVLLNGESGTGKELFAQAIHNASPRKERPFIAINCAALPETLIESELFGYEEGSFTGSKKGGQIGKFELANGGTIFLDEVGDIPLFTQVKLLRVIQEKKISRIGSAAEIMVDIRIVAATHKDLREEVQKGNFRKDLYYRLNVITINIPPLRERMDDLGLLTKHFVNKMSVKLGKKNIGLSQDFLEKVKSYTWPGNIRELENAIERAINLVDDHGTLTSEFLFFDNPSPPKMEEKSVEIKSLKEIERDTIVNALNLYKGNILKVSAKLGIGRNTLYRKIKEYDIK